jgi:hypothetical protein
VELQAGQEIYETGRPTSTFLGKDRIFNRNLKGGLVAAPILFFLITDSDALVCGFSFALLEQ